MRALLSFCAFLFWAVALAPSARAYIPTQAEIAAAVAEMNRGAGRHHVLEVRVALHLGESKQPVASGELLSDPGGLSRLELRSSTGVVERHLLRGGELLASRDRQRIDAARPFLPPLYLLQAQSAGALTAMLRTLGVSTHEVVLGYEGEHDCYVMGGRRPSGVAAPASPRPALWIDQESLEAVRFDRADGVRYRMGPFASFGSLRLPSWIEIIDPRGIPARLEILGARKVAGSAEAFRQDWLSAP